MRGLQSSRETRLGVFAVPEGVYAGRVPGQVGEVSVTDVELVMLEAARRGAGGFVGFRWVNGTPDGRYAGKRGAAVARGGCASRGDEVCSRRLVEQTVIGTVNSSRRMVLGGRSSALAVGFGVGL